MWTAAEALSKNIFKKFYPRKPEWLIFCKEPTKLHIKPDSKYLGKDPLRSDERDLTADVESKCPAVAAFSKPPMPPLFGPFFVFSLLEMVFHTDGKND